MSFVSGTQFGIYRVGAPLGVGGMGEVYRATDTTLERQVAIKVLPDSFAQDADRVARFEREARTLAALNHPNIGQIYGLEKQGDTTALVMELVEGPTLADRIADGPLPPEEALRIARQIIDGLEAAHDKGIVHRDLKPANIKVKADGLVKLLDFGIAKSVDSTHNSGRHTPTMITPAVTESGVIMGTAAYMSPEQARGKFVDERTDIWAFGCVLYEMLTGQPAFGGSDVAETMARIITLDADTGSLTGIINPAVNKTIKLCLQKDVKKRIADIRDVRLSLQGGFTPETTLNAEGSAREAAPLWRRLLPVVASIGMAALVGLLAWQLKPEAARPLARFMHPVTDDKPLALGGPRVIDISADGRRLVYNSSGGLVLREIDALDDHVIPGTQDTRSYPRFAPDGQSLAWINGAGGANPRLMRIAITGGAPLELWLSRRGARGISWQADGTLLVTTNGVGIQRLSANGGEPELIVPIEADQHAQSPELLPGGEWVVFTLGQGDEVNRFEIGAIVAQSLVTGERRQLLQGMYDARYVPTGHLVFGRDSTLYAVGFDPATLAMSGTPVSVLQGIRTEANQGILQYAFANDGTLIYVPGSSSNSGQQRLALGNGTGQAEALAVPVGEYANPRVSPDGRWIAFEVNYQDGTDIAVFEIGSTAAPRRLTFGGDNVGPAWAADGQRVAYYSSRADGAGLYWRLADGTGVEERLTQASAEEEHTPDSFSPDGANLVYTIRRNDSATLWQLVLATGQSSLLIESPAQGASHAVFSPDGRWLAYQAWDTGENEIFVQPFPPTGAKYQVPPSGDNHHPVWAPDGRQLYYIPGGTRFEYVDIVTERGISFGNPVALNLNPLRNQAPNNPRGYEIMPDGSGILGTMFSDSEGSAPDRIVVVQNWFEELERLVPTK